MVFPSSSFYLLGWDSTVCFLESGDWGQVVPLLDCKLETGLGLRFKGKG